MTLEERIAADAAMLRHLGIGVNSEWLASSRESDLAMLHLDIAEHMVNALQFCHGGILYALADTACAYALGSDDFGPATVDANVTYLKPGRLGERVQAFTQVLNHGRRLGTCQVEVRNAKAELLLVYRGTCANVKR